MCLSLFLFQFYFEGRAVHDMVLPKTGRLQRGMEERDRKGAKQELSLHSARTMLHHTDVSLCPGAHSTLVIISQN